MQVPRRTRDNPSRREFGAAIGALHAAGLPAIAQTAQQPPAPGPGSFPLPPLMPVGLRIGNGIAADASYAQLRMQARLGVEYASSGAARLQDASRERLREVRRRFESAGIRPYNFRVEELRDTFTYFVRAVMPVAEEAGVRIGLHPDDPPLPALGGIARIFIDNSRRL